MEELNKYQNFIDLCNKYDKIYKNAVGDLPLKTALKVAQKLENVNSVEDLYHIIYESVLFNKNPKLKAFFKKMINMTKNNKGYIYDDFIFSIKLKQWSETKQIYKFDADFLEVLLSTDNVCVSQDAYDYLPYNAFYIDFSDNKMLCNNFNSSGFFLNVGTELSNGRKIYTCSINTLQGVYLNNAVMRIYPDREVSKKQLEENDKIFEVTHNGRLSNKELRSALYILVVQVLNYMTAENKDLEHSEFTKKNLKKHEKKIKAPNSYAGIEEWNVGVRYGNAIRKYNKQEKNTGTTGTGRKKKPHWRKAHWHHYNGKLHWQCALAINMNSSKDVPIVVHKTKPKKQESRDDL